MKTFYSSLLFLLISLFPAVAQDITGKWYGRPDIGMMKLRLIFTIEKNGEEYTGTLLSPDQSSREIPVSKITFEDRVLEVTVAPIGMVYKANLKEDNTLEGTLHQMGASFPMNMSREEIVLSRPQEPKPPFPYKVEEITFRNENAGINLRGTLTYPEGQGEYPAVVLVTGSGPQNRDEEIMGHKPFAVIADYLTRKGIAVLRYDERGVGESEGNYGIATISDFAKDASAALTYLKKRKEIDAHKTGVIGHSEGGAVAVILASQNEPSFIITLAGPGVSGRDVMRSQREALFKASGLSDDYIRSYNDALYHAEELIISSEMSLPEMEERLKEVFKGTSLSGHEQKALQQLTAPALMSLLKYDPAIYYGNIQCPVLALNGGKDLQVVPGINLEGFKQIERNGNKKVTTKEYPGLNHIFQTAITGLPSEYGQIEETINPEVLKDMAAWILSIHQ